MVSREPLSSAGGPAGMTGPAGLPDRVGQRQQVVVGGSARRQVGREAQDLPAARGGEPLAVLRAEVVGVRLGVRRQRAEHGGLVGVDVGEGRDGGPTAGRARAAAGAGDRCRAHSATVPACASSDAEARHY